MDDAIEFIKYAEQEILKEDWSPDAVCGQAKRLNMFGEQTVCPKTLYNYIERGLIGVKQKICR